MANPGTIKVKEGNSWVDILHPVGSFYLSTSSTSPANLFGGSWTQVTNAAIRGATSIGYTGSDSTTLTVSQIPAHSHTHDLLWTLNPGNPQLGGGNLGFGLQFIFATNTSSVGGGQAHTNVQRCYNCYIWYRTA